MSFEAIRSLRFERLDVLRGVAILMVFVFHDLSAVFKQDVLGWGEFTRDFASAPHPAFLVFYPYTLGYLGVVLFFVISGFCIHWSYLKWELSDRVGQPSNLRQFVADFYWRRLWRIYPPYFLALVIFSLLGGVTLSSWTSIKSFILHAALLHNFNEGHFFAINGVFWSLAVEMQLYAVYPIVILVHRRFKLPGILFLLAIGIFFKEGNLSRLFESRDLGFAVSQLPFTYWPQWLSGVVVADLIARGKQPPAWSGLALLLGIPALYFSIQQIDLYPFYPYLSYLLFSLAVFMATADRRPLSQLERTIAVVGMCSYSLYLYHMLAGRLITAPVAAWSPWWELTFGMLFSLLVLVGLSWLLYQFVEKKTERLGSRLRKRLFNQSAALVAQSSTPKLAIDRTL